MNHSSKFPDLSKVYPGALEAKSIELNGQTVLFDKKVTLMPVEIKKNENHQSNDR